MKLLLPIAILLIAAQAEIIDRIAVTVDKSVVTESEILRQIRITAFLNGQQPDFSPVNKRTTADRLVEQILIRRELETTRYASDATTSSAEYEELVRKFPSPEAYRQALARYGITDAEIREALAWQATLLDFIETRFRPGIQIPASEIREYYDSHVALNPGKLPPFEQAKDDIEKILTQQRVDNALDRWLGQARLQSRIRYTQEVFR
jgi:hypothetical protein